MQTAARTGERVPDALILRWIAQPGELVGLADRGDSPFDRRDRAGFALLTGPLVGA